MDIVEWKEILQQKDVILFDHDYRISLFRFNRLPKKMIGGGKKKNNNNMIKKLCNNYTRILVEGLLTSNYEKIDWIITNSV